jgi:hypothetical protein
MMTNDIKMSDLTDGSEVAVPIATKRPVTARRKQSGRGAKKAVVYTDGMDEDDDF